MHVLEIIRYVVLGLFAVSAVAAVGSWAVTTQRINPFSSFARFIRSTTDPLLEPIERWQVRRGGNPQSAPWYLLGIFTVGGIAIIAGSEWIAVTMARTGLAVRSGPRGVLSLLLYYAAQIVSIAIVARVIGRWVGMGRYHRWMRYAYTLSDWIMLPLRRVVPPVSRFDITPLVALLLLQIVVIGGIVPALR